MMNTHTWSLLRRYWTSLPKTREKIVDNSLEGLADYIKTGRAKKIVVLAGAGISVSCGIPDFRTPGTGLYSNLQKYDLPDPEAIFRLDFFKRNPGPFNEFARAMVIRNTWDRQPSKTHFFLRLLETRGLLHRVYTQNIDTLELAAGVSRDKVIHAHGDFKDAHCVKCHRQQPLQLWKDALLEDQIPRCEHCDGYTKPDIVFFGENLPRAFMDNYSEDLGQADLVITMGTSLMVSPFNRLPTLCDENCVRVLINREKVGTVKSSSSSSSEGSTSSSDSDHTINVNGFRFDSEDNYRDVFLQGECDAVIDDLVVELGLREEFDLVRSTFTLMKDHFQKLIREQQLEE